MRYYDQVLIEDTTIESPVTMPIIGHYMEWSVVSTIYVKVKHLTAGE
jgi:hypothetical protein